AYVQQGIVNFNDAQEGNVNATRFDQALLVDADGNCTDTSANGASVGCAGLNIFGQNNISDQAAEFLRVRVNSQADYEQTVYNLTFAGDLGPLALPGGAIGAAVGFERREEDFAFRPSQDLAVSNNAGFNGSPTISGEFDVNEFYGELYLPILSGVAFADLLDLELAFRTSDFSTSGDVESYKISGSWAPIADLRFRGGYNRAVRAPSIGELFAPQGENAPSATDPCSAAGNPDASTRAICAATGVPAGAIGSGSLNLPAGQVQSISGGNPELGPETADTYTFGVVVQPSAVEGLSLSVDYFDIEIEDYITEFGGGANNVLSTCYDSSAAGSGAGSPFCNVITRRPDGTIQRVSLTTQNVAVQTLKGFDLLASYDFDMLGGDARVTYVGTVTTESDFTAFEGAEVLECSGQFGADCLEPLPEYKHRMSFRWTGDKITGQLLWRMVGEVEDDDDGVQYAVETIDAYNVFDLSGTYRFTDNWWLTVGIDNVADEKPPILGDNQEQANTWPATYDVFGRTFFLRASAEF
ncbi:MAG: TonB-dependent receptor, partial [Pseudomonadota bacterium]